jgi:acetyl esterase/lipase
MSAERRRLLFVAVFFLLPGAAAWSQPPSGAKAKPGPKPPVIPDTVAVERDVQYGKAGEVSLQLDIVRPKEPSEKLRPAVVFIHGGGWSGGNKSGGIGQVLPFAASGNYFCASVEYRLSGVATWPAQIHDCKAAIRWLKANAKKLNIDPERIGVWGSSAGGHLVSLLGVTGGVKELEGDCGSPGQSSRVACVVDFCGPSNFLAIARGKDTVKQGASGPISKLLGGTIEEKKEAAASASPVTYASKDAAPILIVHGTDDATVPLEQAELFYAALKKAGAEATFVKIIGGGHGIGGPEVLKRVQAFFEKHLRGQNVAVSDQPIEAPPAQPRP